MTHGLDVSHYQGDIDWAAVKQGFLTQFQEPNPFAIIKASEGIANFDPQFKDNWEDAHLRGFTCGAYHFLHPEQDGQRQAQAFFAHVGKLSSSDIVPFVDVESGAVDLWQQVPQAHRRAVVDHFLEECDQLFGCRCGIYTAPAWFESTFGADYDHSGRPLWLAGPGRDEPPPPICCWTEVTLWQYTFTSRILGITGDVDMDKALVDLPLVGGA